MYEKTESEEVFEHYLSSQSLTWARISDLAAKHPDYKIQHKNDVCLFEVKEFDEPDVKPSGGFSACPAVREKIRQARKQFKSFKDCCCALVLWNSKSIYRSVLLEAVASAAFGEYVHFDAAASGNLRAEPCSYQFSGSAGLTPKHNTTISAIAILNPYRLNHMWLEMWRELDAKRQRGDEIKPWDQFDILQRLSSDQPATYSYEGTIRTLVLENPYARKAFPPDLFGPFDQRWRMQSGWFSLAFMGAELAGLKRNGVPFIYL
jgi:hypothetical protein